MPGPDRTTLAVLAVVLAIVAWTTLARSAPRLPRGLALLVALAGAFYLYLQLSPTSPGNSVISVGLFVGAAALFRLLSTFEQ